MLRELKKKGSKNRLSLSGVIFFLTWINNMVSYLGEISCLIFKILFLVQPQIAAHINYRY